MDFPIRDHKLTIRHTTRQYNKCPKYTRCRNTLFFPLGGARSAALFQSLPAEILELILVQLIEQLEREAGVEHFGDEFAPRQSGSWRDKRRELKWILSATKSMRMACRNLWKTIHYAFLTNVCVHGKGVLRMYGRASTLGKGNFDEVFPQVRSVWLVIGAFNDVLRFANGNMSIAQILARKPKFTKLIHGLQTECHKMPITSIGPNAVRGGPWLTGYSGSPAEATEIVNVVQGTYQTQRLWENEYLDIIETCPNLEFLELRWIMIAHRSPFWWVEKVVQRERLRRIEISIVGWDTDSLADRKMSRPHKVLNLLRSEYLDYLGVNKELIQRTHPFAEAGAAFRRLTQLKIVDFNLIQYCDGPIFCEMAKEMKCLENIYILQARTATQLEFITALVHSCRGALKRLHYDGRNWSRWGTFYTESDDARRRMEKLYSDAPEEHHLCTILASCPKLEYVYLDTIYACEAMFSGNARFEADIALTRPCPSWLKRKVGSRGKEATEFDVSDSMDQLSLQGKVALDDIALHGGLSDGGWSRILGAARRMERNPYTGSRWMGRGTRLSLTRSENSHWVFIPSIHRCVIPVTGDRPPGNFHPSMPASYPELCFHCEDHLAELLCISFPGQKLDNALTLRNAQLTNLRDATAFECDHGIGIMKDGKMPARTKIIEEGVWLGILEDPCFPRITWELSGTEVDL